MTIVSVFLDTNVVICGIFPVLASKFWGESDVHLLRVGSAAVSDQ